jgi:hypothetical protein
MAERSNFEWLGIRRTSVEPENAQLVTLYKHWPDDTTAANEEQLTGLITRLDQVKFSVDAANGRAALAELRGAKQEVTSGHRPITDFPFWPGGFQARTKSGPVP